MKKPDNIEFDVFVEKFRQESEKAGKKQYVVPYYIASHPGSDLNAMIELALFLKRNGYKPDQVQDFIPAPLDVATCMYYTGMDPFTKQPVHISKSLKDRKMQRALMQFFKPENYFEVRDALREAGRQDLIGNGCDCLIPAQPPREAIDRRREMAGEQFRGEYVHRIGQPNRSGQSDRPGKGDRGGQDSRGKGRRDNQSGSDAKEKRNPATSDASRPATQPGRDTRGQSQNGSRPSQTGSAKRKGPRKQSRYEPGKGYRPDRKAKRLRDEE
jgi:hypothetical protein